jgi:hypothetical protein
VKKPLKDFRRWERGEKSSRVPTAERRNLKKWSPGFLLRRVKHRLLPVAPLEDLRDLPEAHRLPGGPPGNNRDDFEIYCIPHTCSLSGRGRLRRKGFGNEDLMIYSSSKRVKYTTNILFKIDLSASYF